MFYYRLYFMDPHSGHIQRFADFEAPDDDSAAELAREHEGERPLELWCGKNKVMRIEAAASYSSREIIPETAGSIRSASAS